MDVLAGVGDRRGYVAYPEKYNRGARVENAEVAVTRGGEKKRGEREKIRM